MDNAFGDYNIQSGILADGANQLRCLRMGHGKKIMIAFHGFGEDATRFVPLSKLLQEEYTVIAFDFPGTSAGLWKGKNMPDCKTMAYFIHRICAEFNVDKVALMGYSMGARPVLCLTGYLSEKIDQVVLLAPDGMSKNIWYYLATHNFYGRMLFRHILNNPGTLTRYRKNLTKLGLVKQRSANVAQKTLNCPENRKKVLVDWSFTRNFIPNQRFILNKIRKKKIPLLLFMGAHDPVFSVEEGRSFIQGINTAQLHVLECGHQILKDDNLPQIASML